MAGKYGTFKVAADVHVSVGDLDFDFAAGEVTPDTLEEAQALRQLCSSSRQAPGEETSHVLAELVSDPDPEAPSEPSEPSAAVTATAPARAAADPAAPPGSQTGPAGNDLAAAEAEVAKADADLKAAEAAAASGVPPAGGAPTA